MQLTDGPGGLSAGPFPAKLGTTLGLGQAESVLVALDPAIPRGPWDAHIVLRSGMTERDAAANVTFPEAPATSAGPVEAGSGSGGSGRLPLGLGGAALILAIVVVLMLTRRWSRGEPAGHDAQRGG